VIAWADIQRYCDAIAREFHPQRIVVFGSYAYGCPTDDSDLDVMVIMPFSKRRRVRPSLAIRRRVSAGFPVDILVRAPEDIARRLQWGDSFVIHVMTRGKVMYEAGHA
jgi:predicted nucleotidyltransferase